MQRYVLFRFKTLHFYYALHIPQPIYYLWSENINVSFELLRLKVLEIIKDNKEKQLEIIKSKMEE